MNIHERTQEKARLRRERPIDMSFLSCNEAGHFYGYDIEKSVDEGLDYVPVTGSEDGLDFHCQITFYQEDSETNICFRHVCARLKSGEIVSFDHHGIPDERVGEFRDKCRVAYRVMYPNGLTVEMIHHG